MQWRIVEVILKLSSSRWIKVNPDGVAFGSPGLAGCVKLTNVKDQKVKASKAFCASSRRDMVISFTASMLCGITFFAVEPVEARVSKIERKRKILDNLQQLRKKAGVPKTKGGNNDGSWSSPSLEDDKKLESFPPPANLLEKPVRPLVEASLP